MREAELLLKRKLLQYFIKGLPYNQKKAASLLGILNLGRLATKIDHITFLSKMFIKKYVKIHNNTENK